MFELIYIVLPYCFLMPCVSQRLLPPRIHLFLSFVLPPICSRSCSHSHSLSVCSSDLKVALSLANLLYLRWHSLTFCLVVVAGAVAFAVIVVLFSNACALRFFLSLFRSSCLSLLRSVRVYYWYLLNEWIVRAQRHSHIFTPCIA